MELKSTIGEWKTLLSRSVPYLTTLIALLGVLVITYLAMHGGWGEQGYEFQKLTDSDEAQLRAIVEGGATADTNSTGLALLARNANKNKVEEFLDMRFEGWEQAQRTKILGILPGLDAKDVVPYLAAQKFKVGSYFWSIGSWAYLEIVFWTLFGVLCSILYYVTEAIRAAAKDPDSPGFEPDEIPNHFARLAYAPLVSLVLVFGYQFFSGEQFAAIETGKGMLIVSFLLGFYSGRAMKLLDKIKEILLPFGGDEAQRAAARQAGAKAPQFTARLILDPAIQSPDPQALNDQLDNATVSLLRKRDGSLISLERDGDDQDATFVGRDLPADLYILTAQLGSTQGINLVAEQDVDLAKETEVEVMLKASEAVG